MKETRSADNHRLMWNLLNFFYC